MLGKLSSVQIEQVLSGQLVGRIGCSFNGDTYVVPISYAYDGDYIYCHTTEGKKTEIMRKNPRVCFQVDDMRDLANWKSVIVQGQFEEIDVPEARNAAMKNLMNRYLPMISSTTMHFGEAWPFHPEDVATINGVVFRIAVKEKSGRFESSGQSPEFPG